MEKHLTAVSWVVIVAYMASLSLIGLYFSRRQTSRAEYFLGGRSMHWLLIGGSIMATLLSTITYLSVPGEMIRYGVAYFSGYLVLPLVIPVVSRVIIPVIVRLPITSAYEYLEKRYDVTVRSLASVVFIIRSIVWMGLIIYTASFAVTQMTGWDIYWTMLVTGVVTTFYTSAGGLRTVIWTDNLQLLILGGGAAAVPVFVILSLGSGPLAWWESFSQVGHMKIQVVSLDPTVRITVMGSMLAQFFWNISTHSSDQVVVQRYLSTPSLGAARRSVWTCIVFNLILAFLLMLCALSLFAYYSHRSNLSGPAFHQTISAQADRLLPLFIVQELPPALSGLMLAALLAAAMSSLSSAINSISGVVVSDFLLRFGFLEEHSKGLRADKWLSAAAGAIGIGAAMAIAFGAQRTDWNLLELTGRINHLLVGPLAVLFLAGIFFRRVGKESALLGFFLGTAMSLFIAFGKEWFGLERNISFLWVTPISFLVGLIAAGVTAYLFAAPARERIKGLTLSELG